MHMYIFIPQLENTVVLPKYQQIFCECIKIHYTSIVIGIDYYAIFYPYAKFVFNIYSRFNCYSHVCFKNFLVFYPQPWWLMDLKTNSVSSRMYKVFCITRFPYYTSA